MIGFSLTLGYLFLRFFLFRFGVGFFQKTRCEQILRSRPESRAAAELHLACMESKEQEETKKLKDAAIGSAVAVTAVGVAAGIATMLLSKR